ncbi:glutathione S-transferase N-terminal domain-containing protein [Ferrovum sp.]|jgi:glutathione S-transferase|uniref:glutathione S-transferase N-terminal domain-containing protein n=1 Tax=Ferrovum sp. TaxID=2609467 RepID=UPI0026026A92|nr:glutathione S-transferase N-terminal domain-containing protein [Ferrovum sp.]MBW8067307.1 glutathione S-transferase [Ferrovum sp.]
MKLLGSVTSPFVRKVRVVLIEKHIDFELVGDAMTGETPLIEKHNPLGKIPALVLDDGLTLFDSQVITEYLDAISPVGHLIPDNPRERAVVKRWEAMADGILDAGVAIVLEKRRPETEQSPAWMERQRGKMERGLAQMSKELGTRAWCTADALNLSDLATGSLLFWLDFRFPEWLWRQQYPNLNALANKLGQRKSFKETLPNP